MRNSMILAAPLLAVGCIEYDPSGGGPPEQAVFNPYQPPSVHTTDSFEQIQKPEVDILWIVDNSCSMGDEQEELAENFPLFMDYFLGSNLDYHIGVVSTDMVDKTQSGKLIPGPGGIRWIDPLTPEPIAAFEYMAVLGNGGHFPERGIEATYAALELQQEFNEGFIRPNSAINIIVVSDESDFSHDDVITIGEFKQYLIGMRADPEGISFHSIVTPPPPESGCQGTATPGTRYVEVTNAVGGVYWSLCDLPWIGALEQIGLETAGLKREYFLAQRPVDGTIQVSLVENGATRLFVEYDPVTALGDWTYSDPRNSVTFLDFVPEPGSVVNIDYDVLASAERQ